VTLQCARVATNQIFSLQTSTTAYDAAPNGFTEQNLALTARALKFVETLSMSRFHEP